MQGGGTPQSCDSLDGLWEFFLPQGSKSAHLLLRSASPGPACAFVNGLSIELSSNYPSGELVCSCQAPHGEIPLQAVSFGKVLSRAFWGPGSAGGWARGAETS